VPEEAGVVEPGDRRDRLSFERQRDQSVGASDRRMRVHEVAAEGRLGVGPGGHDAQRRAAQLRPVTKKAAIASCPWHSSGWGGMGYYPILDRAPKGRDEGDAFQVWIRRHDEY
jgi:hypothetical protein